PELFLPGGRAWERTTTPPPAVTCYGRDLGNASSVHAGVNEALTFCTPPGIRSRAWGRYGLCTCCRACWGRARRAIPMGRSSERHILDEKRHRAADQSQGCRRDNRRTDAGHGQSGGSLDGHIFEKGHIVEKGHRLGHRCRLEAKRRIVRSPP